ncbi:MAG: hypothetical protein QM820_37740 [Minicystis sp.]
MRTRGQWCAGVLAACAAGAFFIAGCGNGEARAPNPTKPIDERRAIEVIRRAVKSEGVDPAAGRDEKIAGQSKSIHIDVGIAGKRYGVAYLTTEDAQELGEAIPAPNKKDEKLKLVPAGDDGQTRVLLLFQQNYLYDDLAGEAHEQTMITAESALSRDVRDFVTYAKSKKFE